MWGVRGKVKRGPVFGIVLVVLMSRGGLSRHP